MSKEFLDLLRRNYTEDDLIPFAVNKTFYNQKHPENVFARDFEQFHYKMKLIPSQVKALRDKYDLYICFTPCEGGDRKKLRQKTASSLHRILMEYLFLKIFLLAIIGKQAQESTKESGF